LSSVGVSCATSAAGRNDQVLAHRLQIVEHVAELVQAARVGRRRRHLVRAGAIVQLDGDAAARRVAAVLHAVAVVVVEHVVADLEQLDETKVVRRVDGAKGARVVRDARQRALAQRVRVERVVVGRAAVGARRHVAAVQRRLRQIDDQVVVGQLDERRVEPRRLRAEQIEAGRVGRRLVEHRVAARVAQLHDDVGQHRLVRLLHAVAIGVLPHKVADLEPNQRAVKRHVHGRVRSAVQRHLDVGAVQHAVRVEANVGALAKFADTSALDRIWNGN
jgi:hypothetical protein